MAEQTPPESQSTERLRRWHRLFGLLLLDHLADSPFSVELEMDLSQRQQLLDVVVVRRRPGRLTRPLPDGLDDLADHNLISFKSCWEPLNDWALKELTGHYVNYRKKVSPRGRLLPEVQFRMIAVCARRPRDLFTGVPPEPLRPGVHLCRRGTDAISVVVAAELPQEERNALLHLFSAAPEQIQYGVEHYRIQQPDTSTIVRELFSEFRVEGLPMPYTMQDFKREVAEGLWPSAQVLKEFSPEERLAGLPAKKRLAGLSAEEVLECISPEQIEAYLKRRAAKKPAAASGARKKKPKGRS